MNLRGLKALGIFILRTKPSQTWRSEKFTNLVLATLEQ